MRIKQRYSQCKKQQNWKQCVQFLLRSVVGSYKSQTVLPAVLNMTTRCSTMPLTSTEPHTRMERHGGGRGDIQNSTEQIQM